MAKHAAMPGSNRPDLTARRTLYRYPDTGPRYLYLSIAVASTIVLYYELYVFGGVAPLVLAHYRMSFSYYVNILVVANLIGAFGSLAAGLGDRWGRINIVVYGLAVTGMLSLLTPLAATKASFALMLIMISVVEGAVLVATPALVRDFSPQLGRASAMGFWAVGPVAGSLIVSFVANRTLQRFGDSWESQYYLVGAAGLVMCAVAFFGLRELSPPLRDQVLVGKEDRKVLEVHVASGSHRMRTDVPWSHVARPDILLPALGISLFLLVYYVAIGFSTLYLSTLFGFTTHEVNGLNTWFWLVNAVTLIAVGALSDRLRVRKPFMVVGTVLTILSTYLLIGHAGRPDTGGLTVALILGLLGLGLGTAYVPWMAAFTETVERCNPALIAPGLAIWGWLVRICACLSFFLLPIIVGSMNTLVDATATGDVAAMRAAAAQAPAQWRHWWWICIVAQVAFLLLMLPLAGRWSSRAARADLDAHRRRMRRLLPYQPPVRVPWSE
ncbi:MFS transporter [Actinocorallia longicatena]|uniref:Major facilitator superfamily (MFS) profile domain-containing protein n=1 Tax=Actinocorallia longicatena TaxID=111803 RepID=A0ABP6QJ15_9ACTN